MVCSSARSRPFAVDGLWHDPAQTAPNVQWVRDFYDDLQPHSTGQIYVNFLGGRASLP